jgi:hypothetical protein
MYSPYCIAWAMAESASLLGKKVEQQDCDKRYFSMKVKEQTN